MRLIYWLVLISIILSACASGVDDSVPSTPAMQILTATPTAAPSPTSTSAPSATPTATKTIYVTPEPTPTSTLFPTATPIPVSGQFPGKLYVVDGSEYGWLDPNVNEQEFIHSLEDGFGNVKFSPYVSSFSPYTQKFAYVLENQEKYLELWLSDLDLTQEQAVWSDRENWLNHTRMYYEVLYMDWGPGDMFIIIRMYPEVPEENQYYGIVYSLREHTTTRLAGPCDRIGKLPRSNRLSVFCPVGTGDRYLVLEYDGQQWESSTLPEEIHRTVKFAFTMDGKRALLATEKGEIYILDEDGKVLEYRVRFLVDAALGFETKTLQWSRDGSKVLMYVDGGASICKPDTSGFTWCWIVADAATGKILWKPAHDSVFEAGLSPDGQWVTISYDYYDTYGFRQHFAVISSLDRNTVKIVTTGGFSQVCWAD